MLRNVLSSYDATSLNQTFTVRPRPVSASYDPQRFFNLRVNVFWAYLLFYDNVFMGSGDWPDRPNNSAVTVLYAKK